MTCSNAGRSIRDGQSLNRFDVLAESLGAVGYQLHERLGVIFVAVLLRHELHRVEQNLQGRQTLLTIDH